MKKLLFLVSRDGGLLKFMKLCIEKGILPGFMICNVIADRNCGGYDYAMRKGIPCQIVDYNKNDRKSLLHAISDIDFDYCITTFAKIIDRDIVNRYEGALINVHPSLLPAFAGIRNATDKALESGVKFVGTTVHYVDEGADTGEIIAQSVMPVDSNRSDEAILDNQFRSWCLNLLNVLIRLTDENAIDKATVFQSSTFNPPLCFETDKFDDTFWSEIKNA
jgi:phosphoribosylglycinamide formyltransferase-1